MGFRGGASGAGSSVQFAPPSESIEIGDPAVAGISPRVPRADHGHAFPAPGAGSVTNLAGAKGDGGLNAPARVDHVHGHTVAMHVAGGHADLSPTFGGIAFRQATGAIAGGALADVVVPINPALPDANYTAEPEVEEATAGNTLEVLKIVSRAANQIVVRVRNNDALNAFAGTLHVLIRHDSQNPAISAYTPIAHATDAGAHDGTFTRPFGALSGSELAGVVTVSVTTSCWGIYASGASIGQPYFNSAGVALADAAHLHINDGEVALTRLGA